ncbi:hypothetical protein CSQ79_15360 [Gloeocapsopsis sp. IPPAS B-1203]|nr:hypothetical protein CSQ79_15360 [Gloeocapsopsis sp. IPPAS B-1203]
MECLSLLYCLFEAFQDDESWHVASPIAQVRGVEKFPQFLYLETSKLVHKPPKLGLGAVYNSSLCKQLRSPLDLGRWGRRPV